MGLRLISLTFITLTVIALTYFSHLLRSQLLCYLVGYTCSVFLYIKVVHFKSQTIQSNIKYPGLYIKKHSDR